MNFDTCMFLQGIKHGSEVIINSKYKSNRIQVVKRFVRTGEVVDV